MSRRNLLGIVAATIGLAGLVAVAFGGPGGDPDGLPTGDADRGRVLFEQRCAACHGAEGGGTAQGPPLVHPFYRPDHHADGAFLLAVRRGVTPHHWDFGPMPPIPNLSDQDVADVTRYVRDLQEAAGIR